MNGQDTKVVLTYNCFSFQRNWGSFWITTHIVPVRSQSSVNVLTMIKTLRTLAQSRRYSGGTSSSKKYLTERVGPLSSWLSGHARQIETSATEGKRQKLIILGTGWASYAVLKNIDKKKYDVIVVSPRNHFLFTPLLCSTTVGTLEFRLAHSFVIPTPEMPLFLLFFLFFFRISHFL